MREEGNSERRQCRQGIRVTEKAGKGAETSEVGKKDETGRPPKEVVEEGKGALASLQMCGVLPGSAVKKGTPRVRIMGDSLLRHAGEMPRHKGYVVDCFPGVRTEGLERIIGRMKTEEKTNGGNDEVVVIHVGTNDVKRARTSDHVVGWVWDMCTAARTAFSSAKIIISGILRRRDVPDRIINYINEGFDWVCKMKGMYFVDPNCWLKTIDRGRDGLHLNRSGSQKFGKLICDVVEMYLSGN